MELSIKTEKRENEEGEEKYPMVNIKCWM